MPARLTDPEAHKRLKELLQFMAAAPSSTDAEVGPPDVLFSHDTLGGVSLSGEEAKRYNALLRELVAGFSSRRYLTRQTLARMVQAAILTVFGPEATGDTESRIKKAVDGFRAALSRTVEPWTVYLPVEGFRVAGRPFLFGGVRFRSPEAAVRREVRRAASAIIQTTRHTSDVRRQAVEAMSLRIDEVLGAQAVAEIEVLALDAVGAEVEARHIAELTESVLNFYGSVLVRPDPMRVLIGSPTRPHESLAIVLKPGQHVTATSSQKNGLTFVEPSAFRSAQARRCNVRWVSDLLCSAPTNAVHRRLLSAASWAGQAVLQRQSRHAFLMYAIALETLLMPSDSGSELSYRLRTRAAHVLARTPENRLKVHRELGRLYGVRSKIVHTGADHVEEKDLGTLRHMVNVAILSCLGQSRLRSTGIGDEAFQEWFERRTVR